MKNQATKFEIETEIKKNFQLFLSLKIAAIINLHCDFS